jgi:sporulation protein YlmC with PRC-barrel domain
MRLFALILAALAFGAQAALTAPASELIGKSVVDPARADLGRVEDLMVDLRERRVHYAVLGFGGWAGLLDKQFAIPIEEFTPAPFGDKLVLERAKELLLLEPGIDSTGPPDGDEEYWRGIDRWYERHDSRGVPLRQYVRARALLGRDVVDRTGEALGELRDFEIDLATGEVRRALLAAEGDLRRVPVQKLLAPASGAALVLNIEQREESP